MKIDIILCTHNSERTIEQCITSILNQTYKKFKLYVFEDASTDETLKILKGYRDPRIKIIASEKNMGTYAGKNFILKRFCKTSDYVALHDADDYSHHERLEIQSNFLRENDLVCAGTGVIEFWEEGMLPWTKHSGEWIGNKRENYYPELLVHDDLEKILEYLKNEDLYYKYLKFKFCMNGSVMFKTSFLNAIGGWDGRTHVAADTDIFIRTLANNNIRNVQKCLYYRRFHKNSLTARKDLGIKSDFRKKYNLDRIPVVEEALQGKNVVRDFYHPALKCRIY